MKKDDMVRDEKLVAVVVLIALVIGIIGAIF